MTSNNLSPQMMRQNIEAFKRDAETVQVSLQVYKDQRGGVSWMATIISGLGVKLMEGSGKGKTCPQMELESAIEVLEAFDTRTKIHFLSQSAYLPLGISQHIAKWKASGWKGSNGLVKHRALWEKLEGLLSQHDVLITQKPKISKSDKFYSD